MKKRMFRYLVYLMTLSCLSGFFNPLLVGASVNAKKREMTNRFSETKRKKYSERYLDYSLKIFKKSIKNNENTLISPLSVLCAAGMLANGADQNTLKEIESSLGMTKEEINEYIGYYMDQQASDRLFSDNRLKFSIANSIWVRNLKDFDVDKDFLKKNMDFYHAKIYKSRFDSSTLSAINSWIDKKTDGLIKNALDKIGKDAVMYLINALVFDGKWQNPYNKNDIHRKIFNSYSGKKNRVKMMESKEYGYISDKKASGFIKYYEGGKYAFIALLPNSDMDIKDYIQTLSAKKLRKMISKPEDISVEASLPAFQYDYKIELVDVFKEMGIKDAFDMNKANFNNISKIKDGLNLFVSRILHKTQITVDELGTKAGAVTIVEMNREAMIERIKSVSLDRPFLYMIVDTENHIPIFIGTVMEIGK